MNPEDDSRLRFTNELEERKMQFLQDLTPSHPMDVSRRLSLISALAHSAKHPMEFDCGCEECDARLRSTTKAKAIPQARHSDIYASDSEESEYREDAEEEERRKENEWYDTEDNDELEPAHMASTRRPHTQSSSNERVEVGQLFVEIDLDTPRSTSRNRRNRGEQRETLEENRSKRQRASERFQSTPREPSGGGSRALPLTGSRSRSSIASDSETMITMSTGVVHPEGTTLVYNSMHSRGDLVHEGEGEDEDEADESESDTLSESARGSTREIHSTPNVRANLNTSPSNSMKNDNNRVSVECEMSPFLISPNPKDDSRSSDVEQMWSSRIQQHHSHSMRPLQSPPPLQPSRKVDSLNASRHEGTHDSNQRRGSSSFSTSSPLPRPSIDMINASLEDPRVIQQQYQSYRPELQPEPHHPPQYSRSPPLRDHVDSRTVSQGSHPRVRGIEGLSRSLNRLQSYRTSFRDHNSSSSGGEGEGSCGGGSVTRRSSRVHSQTTRGTTATKVSSSNCSASSTSDYRAIYPVHRPARLAERFVEIAYHEHSHPYCVPSPDASMNQQPTQNNNNNNNSSGRSEVSDRVLDTSAIQCSIDSVSRATWIVDTFSPMEAEQESSRRSSDSIPSTHALSMNPEQPQQSIMNNSVTVAPPPAPCMTEDRTRGGITAHRAGECRPLGVKDVKLSRQKTGMAHRTETSTTTGSISSPWVPTTNPLRYLNEGTVLSPMEKSARPQPTSAPPQVVADPRTYLTALHRHNAEQWKYTTVSKTYPRCSTWRIDSFL